MVSFSGNPNQIVDRQIARIADLAKNGDYIAATKVEHELFTAVIQAFARGDLGLAHGDLILLLDSCSNLQFPRLFE